MTAHLTTGTRVMGYRVDALLGRGGQGTVYQAEHVLLNRKVALKVLLPELAADDGFRRRFTQEARLAASLDHPNILDVYDFGDVDGMLFLAVKFVNGDDLGTLLHREGGLAPDRAVALLSGVADGLDTAHAAGLVHRDVKPGNVLIERRSGGREHSYLSDFGLTKSVSTKSGDSISGPLTRTGFFVGTPEYAAPEQIESAELDGRTDQYALGCVLFQCLTGRLPFPRDSLGSALVAHMMEAPPRVTGVRGDLSPAIDGVVAKAMSKSRSDRYATCAEMMGAAKEALRGAPGHAVPPPPMPTVTRPDAPPLSPMPQMPVPAQVVTPPPGPVQDEPSSPVPQFPPPQLIPSPPPQPSPSPPPQSLNFPPPQGSPVAPQPSVPGRTTPQPPPLAYPPPGYGEQVPEPVAKRTKTAFTCGVVGVCLGIFFVGLPIAIIAIVQGLKARTELDELRTAPVLRAKAQRAVTLGWIGIGLTVFSVIAQIVQAVK